MAETTKIEWTHHTFNPWRSCEHARLPDGSEHPGCANCYAEAMSRRNPKVLGVWGPQGTRVVAAESQWKAVERWNREAGEAGERHRVFCASLADVFEDWTGPMVDAQRRVLHKAADWSVKGQEWIPVQGVSLGRSQITMSDVRARLFRLIDSCPNLDFLLVTKRPENVRRMWPTEDDGAGGRLANAIFGRSGRLVKHRQNVWLLTSVSDQQTADAMIPPLLQCRDLVPVLGISAEPLIGPIHVEPWLTREYEPTEDYAAFRGLDWVIVGGESGSGARPCRVDWIRSIVDQCRRAEVPVFVKQLGANAYGVITDQPHAFNHGFDRLPHGTMPENESRLIVSDPKGGDQAEWPDDLRVRQFPEVPQ